MANEVALGLQWLVSTLSGDGTLTGYAPGGVWRGMAPPGTTTPFTVIGFQAGSDVITANAFRLMVSALFLVKVSGPASNTAALVNAASRIDSLIGSPPTIGAVTGGLILSSYRETPTVVDSLVSGEEWSEFGGLYRLQIESTS
jgi:hypothetical protein